MSLNACSLCQAPTLKTFKNDRCRGCHEIERNRENTREIQLKFSSASAFNDRIFQACLQELTQFRVQRIDVREVARLASILSHEPMEKPRSWAEARVLSNRLAIRFSNNRTSNNDLILRIAEDLEKSGEIKEPDFSLAPRYEKALNLFDPAVREHIEHYLAEIARGQKTRVTALNMIRSLMRLQQFLNGNIFNPEPEAARAYFKLSPPINVKTTRRTLVNFKRFYRWSIKQRLTTTNPFESWHPECMIRTCKTCEKTCLFSNHDQVCDACYWDVIYLAKLDRISQSYRTPSSYNQHLFDLYIRYVKRAQIRSRHIILTRALIKYLEANSIPAIRTWYEIKALSNDFSQKQKYSEKMEHPFLKIGKMLQELGVLSVRQTDSEIHLKTLYSKCAPETARVLRRYDQQLIKMRHSMSGRHGTIRFIFEFQHWVTINEPGLGLFTLHEETALRYLKARNDGDRSGIRRQVLSKFYRWAQLERLTLLNPFKGIPVPKPAKTLCVCSDQQIKLIERYVKNKKSDPEYALILALVLYWGVTSRELALSSIEIYDCQIWINLYRRELSRRRKSHNRDQILKLPLNPPWLASLQKRYISMWRERFENAKKTFSNQPLLLKRLSIDRSIRPLSMTTVIDIFCRASIAATGQRIPPNVVRRTSGHIHVDYGDASRLTKLGWSKTHSNEFSSRQRTYFSAEK